MGDTPCAASAYGKILWVYNGIYSILYTNKVDFNI
jgi:hypothetical protein